jgi:hypothetical protein
LTEHQHVAQSFLLAGHLKVGCCVAEQMQNVEPLKEIFDQMFALLESLETQNIAVVQFLKDEGIAADDKLAPYLEKAGNASSVKWRAARARMEHLLTPIPVAAKQTAETRKPEKTSSENTGSAKDDEDKKDSAEKAKSGSREVEPEKKGEANGQKAADEKTESGDQTNEPKGKEGKDREPDAKRASASSEGQALEGISKIGNTSVPR